MYLLLLTQKPKSVEKPKLNIAQGGSNQCANFQLKGQWSRLEADGRILWQH